MKIKLLTLAALSLLLTTTGCGNARDESRAGESSQGMHLSRAVDYSDMTSLVADSTAVIVARAGRSAAGALNGLPTTITQVKVNKVIKGQLGTDTISIQQVGDRTVTAENGAEILRAGADYLLFIKPFHLEAGDDTGLHTITGARGAYLFSPSRNSYELKGGEGSRLPAELTAADLTRLAN